jgi:hypothetical protein
LLRGEFQIAFECFSDHGFHLGVHPNIDKPPDVEPGFYEVSILDEGIKDSGGSVGEEFLGAFQLSHHQCELHQKSLVLDIGGSEELLWGTRPARGDEACQPHLG